MSLFYKTMENQHINLLVVPHRVTLPSGSFEFPNSGLITSAVPPSNVVNGVDIIAGNANALSGSFVKDPKMTTISKVPQPSTIQSTPPLINEVGDLEPGDSIWQRCQVKGCRVTIFKPLVSLHESKKEQNSVVKTGQQWKISTEVACYHCTFPFESRPIPFACAFSKTRQLFSVTGCFCSFECALAWGHKERKDLHVHHWFYRIITDSERPKLTAAPPISMLRRFGGIWDIEQYRSTFGAPIIATELVWPIVFHTNAVEVRETVAQSQIFDTLEEEKKQNLQHCQIYPPNVSRERNEVEAKEGSGEEGMSTHHQQQQQHHHSRSSSPVWSDVGTPYTYHQDGGAHIRTQVLKKKTDLALRARIEQARKNKRKATSVI